MNTSAGRKKTVKNKYAHKYKHFEQIAVVTDSDRNKEKNCSVKQITSQIKHGFITHKSTTTPITPRCQSLSNTNTKELGEPFPPLEERVRCTTSWNGDKKGSTVKSHTSSHKRSDEAKSRRIENRKNRRRINRQEIRNMRKSSKGMAPLAASYTKAQERQISDFIPPISTYTNKPDTGAGISRFLWSEEINI